MPTLKSTKVGSNTFGEHSSVILQTGRLNNEQVSRYEFLFSGYLSCGQPVHYKLCSLKTVLFTEIMWCQWRMNEFGVLVHWHWQLKRDVLGETPVAASICPPQSPHGQVWYWTRAFAETGQRLTTWAMTRPHTTRGCRCPLKWQKEQVKSLHALRQLHDQDIYTKVSIGFTWLL